MLDINPMKKVCRYCEMEVITYVEHELSPMFWVSCLAFLLLFGVMGFILMPLAYLLLKNAVHRCSRCLAHLGTKQFFGLADLDFSHEILKFNVGQAIVVLNKKIALVVFGTLFVIFLYFAWWP